MLYSSYTEQLGMYLTHNVHHSMSLLAQYNKECKWSTIAHICIFIYVTYKLFFCSKLFIELKVIPLGKVSNKPQCYFKYKTSATFVQVSESYFLFCMS